MQNPSYVDIEVSHFGAHQLSDLRSLAHEYANVLQLGDTIATIGERSAVFSLLIDDYNFELPVSRAEAVDTISSWTHSPNYLVWERDLVDLAAALIHELRQPFVQESVTECYMYTKSDDVLLWSDDGGGAAGFLELFASRHNLTSLSPPLQTAAERHGSTTPTDGFGPKSTAASRTLLSTGQNGGRKYSCSLLTACWHLARLGVEPFGTAVRTKLTALPVGSPSKIWSILPAKYIKVEASAMEIISLCKSRRLYKQAKNIRHVFY